MNLVPSNCPTKYCSPDPPCSAPGFKPTFRTHLVFCGSPSTRQLNQIGTFPLTGNGAGRPEVAQLLPAL